MEGCQKMFSTQDIQKVYAMKTSILFLHVNVKYCHAFLPSMGWHTLSGLKKT